MTLWVRLGCVPGTELRTDGSPRCAGSPATAQDSTGHSQHTRQLTGPWPGLADIEGAAVVKGWLYPWSQLRWPRCSHTGQWAGPAVRTVRQRGWEGAQAPLTRERPAAAPGQQEPCVGVGGCHTPGRGLGRGGHTSSHRRCHSAKVLWLQAADPDPESHEQERDLQRRHQRDSGAAKDQTGEEAGASST